MSACGKPPNTEAFSTWPVSSAWLAMPISVFIGSRDGRVDQRAAHDRPVAPHHLRLDLAGQHAHQRAAGAAGGVGHVDVGIGAVAGHDRGALDHGVGHLGVEIERDRDRHVGGDLADAVQQLAFAVVVVLGDHGAVQGEQDGVAALPDLVDDRRRHLLVGGLGDEARGMGGGRHRHGEFRPGLAGHLDEAAEGGVGPLGLLDGARAAQLARAGEGLDRAWAAARTYWSRASSSRPRTSSRQHCPPKPLKPLSTSTESPTHAGVRSLACAAISFPDSCALQKSNTCMNIRRIWLSM